MSVRSVFVRGLLLTGLAAAVSLATRETLVAVAVRHLEGAGDALALIARRLPESGKQADPSLEPSSLDASAETITIATIASASPAKSKYATSKSKTTKSRTIAGSPTTTNSNVVRVTRAEVEAAIANKLGGARTKIARDESGKLVGLALYHTTALARFGVQDGDVLVAANGFSLRTAEEAFAALAALKDATRVTVTFRRGASRYAIAVEVATMPDEPR